MPQYVSLTMDAANAGVLAAFWKLVLGYEDAPPPPPFATREEWLAHYDVPEDEWSGGAWLHDPAGVGPRLSILEVPEPKTAKNRLHLDVRVSGDDRSWPLIQDAVRRFTEAGGSVLAVVEGHHVVMADPEGNEFCVA